MKENILSNTANATAHYMNNADPLLSVSTKDITGTSLMSQQGIIKIDREELCSYKLYSTWDKVILSKVAESLNLRDL